MATNALKTIIFFDQNMIKKYFDHSLIGSKVFLSPSLSLPLMKQISKTPPKSCNRGIHFSHQTKDCTIHFQNCNINLQNCNINGFALMEKCNKTQDDSVSRIGSEDDRDNHSHWINDNQLSSSSHGEVHFQFSARNFVSNGRSLQDR